MIETHQIHERVSERILEKEHLMITERTLGGGAITPFIHMACFDSIFFVKNGFHKF